MDKSPNLFSRENKSAGGKPAQRAGNIGHIRKWDLVSMVAQMREKVHHQAHTPAGNSRREIYACAVSPNWRDKTNLAEATLGLAAHSKEFIAYGLTLAQITEFILSGHRVAPGTFRDDYRSADNWQGAALAGLDYDDQSVAALAGHPIISPNAFLIHPSSSSGLVTEKNPSGGPRSRVWFALPERISNRNRYEMLVEGLYRLIGQGGDESTKSVATAFYGSTNRAEQPVMNFDAVLSPETMYQAIELISQEREQERLEWERRRAELNYQPVEAGSEWARQKVSEWLGNACHRAASATHERTNVINDQAIWLYGLLAGGWPITDADIERALLDAAAANGALHDYGQKEILRAIHNGQKYATPIPLERPERPARPDDIERKYADTLQDARAILDALPAFDISKAQAGQGLSQSDKPSDYRHSHNANLRQNSDEAISDQPVDQTTILNCESHKLSDPPKVYTTLNRSVTPDPELRLIQPSAAAHDHLPTEGELQTANHALYGAGPIIYWIMRTSNRPFWTRALIVEEAQRRGLPLTNSHVDNWLLREGEYFSVNLDIELVKEHYVLNYGKVPNGRLPVHFRLRDLSECHANLFVLAQKRLKERAVKAAKQDAQDADANDPIWWDDDLAQAIADDLDISPHEGEILKNRVNTHYTRQRAEDETFRKRINRAYRKFKRPEQELADKLKASDFADFEIPDYLKDADDTPLNIYYAAFLKWYNDQNPGQKVSLAKIARLTGVSGNSRPLYLRRLARLEHADENATRFVAEIDIPADLPEDERPGYLQRQLTQLSKENEARPLRLSIEDYDAAYSGENVRTIAKAANVIYAEFRQAAPLVFKPDLPAPKKQATSSSSATITPDEPATRRAAEHPYGIDYWPTFRQGQIREAIKSRGWTLDTGHWIDPTGQHRVNDRLALLLAFDMSVSESEIMLSIHHMSEKYDEREDGLPAEHHETERHAAPVFPKWEDPNPVGDWWGNFRAVMYPRERRRGA